MIDPKCPKCGEHHIQFVQMVETSWSVAEIDEKTLHVDVNEVKSEEPGSMLRLECDDCGAIWTTVEDFLDDCSRLIPV